MSQLDLLAFAEKRRNNTAVERRDAALKSVSRDGEWIQSALDVIATMSGEATGEQIRLRCEPLIGTPHHHNAWGAVVRTVISRGLIRFANRYQQMQTPKSHARKTPVYFFVGGR